MATLERIPFATQKKIFKRLADIADSRCLSKEEMEKYEESQRVVDNYNLGMYSAWYQGNEEGIEKGIEKGKIDTQIATAKNFLAMKLTPEQVCCRYRAVTRRGASTHEETIRNRNYTLLYNIAGDLSIRRVACFLFFSPTLESK